jgi:DNA-binding beta-propeller fold protein YncE
VTKLIPLAAVLLLPSFSSAGDKVILVAGGGADTNTTAPIKATDAKLNSPFGVDFDAAGNLYLVEMTGHRVRKLDQAGMLTVIAGTGEKGWQDGSGRKARFNGPHNLAILGGTMFLADTWNHCVRALKLADGTVARTIGTGTKGFSGDDGPAGKAEFGGIYCVSVGGDKHLYFADLDNRRIRALDPNTGRVRTVAGSGSQGVPADGAHAAEAPLVDPRAVIADAQGRVYVLERGGHALRVVDLDGRIRTLAGTGAKGNTGDGGDARQATLNGPKHLCFDGDGNILIADTENHVIRKLLLRENRLIRVAGTGSKGSRGLGGPPLAAELNQPHGVYVHRNGALFISDSSNHRVLQVVKD